MISNSQIRAARALLGWSREQLAQASGLSPQTLFNIENDEAVRPQSATLQAIIDAFLSRGVEFTDRGVRWADVENALVVLSGTDAYMTMLDRVYSATRKAATEVLWFCSDDRTTQPGEIYAEERIRANGTRFRCLIEEGNEETRWPREEYRQMPSEYFNHDLQVIYGHEVAQLIDGGRQILIITNMSLAQTERNKFNLLWPHMTPLSKKKAVKILNHPTGKT